MRKRGDSDRALAIELLVEALYSKKSIERGGRVCEFDSQTSILNLLLMVSRAKSEEGQKKQHMMGVNLREFPLAASYIDKHIAKRNMKNGERLVVDSQNVKLRGLIDEHAANIHNPYSGRISKVYPLFISFIS